MDNGGKNQPKGGEPPLAVSRLNDIKHKGVFARCELENLTGQRLPGAASRR